MVVNKSFILNGIKMILEKNYGINTDTMIDLEAEIDETLSFEENWTIIKEKVNLRELHYDYFRCLGCNYRLKEDWVCCPKCRRDV